MAIMLGTILINQAIIQYFLFDKKNDSHLIDIGGKQRMLSQRIDQLSFRNVVLQKDNHDQLTSTLNTWKTAQLAIMNGNEDLKISKITNKDTYSKLNSGLKIINNIDSIIRKGNLNDASLTLINKNVDEFLPLMENIVNDLTKITDKKLSNIIIIEIILALLTIIIIFVEFQLIIKPSYNKILSQNNRLREIAWKQSHELRKPIATILGISNAIQNNASMSTKEKNKCLSYLFKATEELDQVTHEIVNKTS
ncbi:PilJ/NarX-like methyl-accepting chemotaxis transducer [Tenacibaculum caenipelagi]|uniref:PilJ/NarX-like methyl-accepting chemotaxis transducer n=2 Tax=Tenacibaculum caenipelagi TaxID=1325435 RepID=A0A4R6TD62_9FLAO|nr:PilJ/NarX-like methyl-accepting chemotaxis transducer [Tenacibaculum caenipelagi]